jgi:hypothetical protein
VARCGSVCKFNISCLRVVFSFMAGELNKILRWTREHGEVRAFERLRLRLLRYTVKEGFMLDHVTDETRCSDNYLREARKAASEVVGRDCPF